MGIFDKLTDHSLFTGAHKQRFDKDGKGRGLHGRDSVAKGKGTYATAQRLPAVARTKHTLASADDWAEVRKLAPRAKRSSWPADEASAAALTGEAKATHLRTSFGAWCDPGQRTMTGSRFRQLCMQTKLVGRGFVISEIDAVFACAASGTSKMNLVQFERALAAIAIKREQSLDDVSELVYLLGGPRVPRPNSPTSVIVDKLTDTTKYTGAHKARFDKDGNGRGLHGRDSIPKGKGHIPAGAGLNLRRYANPSGNHLKFRH